jgi:hypothetical protein
MPKKGKYYPFKSKEELEKAEKIFFFADRDRLTAEERRLIRKYLQYLRQDPLIRRRLKGVRV